MKLTLYIRNKCCSCDRVINHISDLIKDKTFIEFQIKNLEDNPVPGLVIVPALFIDDELYVYGDINEKRFLKRLKDYSDGERYD